MHVITNKKTDQTEMISDVFFVQFTGKGKVHHTPLRERRRVLISLSKALSRYSVLVLSPLRAQQFGILCLTVCVIQLLCLISFDVT